MKQVSVTKEHVKAVPDHLEQMVEALRHAIPDSRKAKRFSIVREALAKVTPYAKRISDVKQPDRNVLAVELNKGLGVALSEFLPVFSLTPFEKIPTAGSSGFKDATRDPKKIAAMVDATNRCNWGWHTVGPAAIDKDTKPAKEGRKTGTETWAGLTGGEEPDTFTVLTPTQGNHYFVEGDLPTGKDTLGHGVDTRGSGGYVVAPGSFLIANGKDIRSTGYYSVTNDRPVIRRNKLKFLSNIKAPIAYEGERGLPPEVEIDTQQQIDDAIKLLQDYASAEPEYITRPDGSKKQINGPAIENQGGDVWTLQVAMEVGDIGISRPVCLELMAEHFNPSCQPPWKSDDEGAAKDRLSTKVESAYNSRQTPPGGTHPFKDFADDPVPDNDNDSDDDSERKPATTTKRRSRLKASKLSEIANDPEPVMILTVDGQGMIAEGLTVVYGLPKSGKSYWLFGVVVCFAARIPYNGVELAKHGRVLYIAAEGSRKAVYNRIKRDAAKRGVKIEDLEDVIEIVSSPVDLNTKAAVDEFLRENPGRWNLVIVDTLARNMSGDENSTKDMNGAVAACDRIKNHYAEKSGSCDIILVHHQGWAKVRPRGAIALFGALDGLIRVFRNALGQTVVKVEELREGEVKDNNGLLYKIVGGVMEQQETQSQSLEKLRERERKMYDLLVKLSKIGPVDLKDFRDAVFSADIFDDAEEGNKAQQDKRSKNFRRALQHMREFKIITIDPKTKMIAPAVGEEFIEPDHGIDE